MARKPRLHTPGAVYHVILRGNAQQDIFSDDKDRYRFYTFLSEASACFDHRILAFCLMTNHVHLQIQVGQQRLSRIIQSVSQRYTQWFNWRYHRTGHVFQGRFKAVMVDADEYLKELAAYIHLNPVRAHLADTPEEYRWSSCNAYLGKEKISWLDTTPVLEAFSSDIKKAVALFFAFVHERLSEGRMKGFHGEKNADSRIFGDDHFTEVVLAQAEALPLKKPGLAAVLAAVKDLYQMSDEELTAPDRHRKGSEARCIAAWATLELSSGTLTELARFLRRDPSTLTTAIQRIQQRRERDAGIDQKMKQLQDLLSNSSSPGLTL